MKKLIFCILALLLLTTAAFAVPGDSCVVLGEELTLGETDGIFTALGVERGTAMELPLSRPDAETYFSDVPEKAASVGVFVRIRSGGEGLSLSLSNITGAETAIAAALTAALAPGLGAPRGVGGVPRGLDPLHAPQRVDGRLPPRGLEAPSVAPWRV